MWYVDATYQCVIGWAVLLKCIIEARDMSQFFNGMRWVREKINYHMSKVETQYGTLGSRKAPKIFPRCARRHKGNIQLVDVRSCQRSRFSKLLKKSTKNIHAARKHKGRHQLVLKMYSSLIVLRMHGFQSWISIMATRELGNISYSSYKRIRDWNPIDADLSLILEIKRYLTPIFSFWILDYVTSC